MIIIHFLGVIETPIGIFTVLISFKLPPCSYQPPPLSPPPPCHPPTPTHKHIFELYLKKSEHFWVSFSWAVPRLLFIFLIISWSSLIDWWVLPWVGGAWPPPGHPLAPPTRMTLRFLPLPPPSPPSHFHFHLCFHPSRLPFVEWCYRILVIIAINLIRVLFFDLVDV